MAALRRKMAIYQANGAQLGWLLIPEQRAVEVWPASGRGEPVRLEAATQLDARPLFPGLQREPCTPASYPAKATTRPLASDKLFYFLFQSQPDLILRWLRDLPEDAGGYSFSAPVLKEREYRLDQRLFWDINPVL